jgi:4-amino-4-deoxy-L-arabinose transferase-like glycosyltransferase
VTRGARAAAAGAAVWVAALAGLAAIGQPLGHDEAVYALGGRLLLGGAASPFPLHRPVGMEVLAAPAAAVGGGLWAFRAIAIAATAAFVVASWACARRAFGGRVAGWTVAVVATSFALVRRGDELLPDAAAGALVLAFTAILIGGLGSAPDPAAADRAPRWRLAWLGPLAGAAFYVRYGSIGVVGGISAAALIVWRRRLRRNAGPILVAVGLTAVAAVPHVIYSERATGSALGILRAASELAGRGYTGQGLVFYGSAWWLWLGPVAAVCVAAGLIAGLVRRGEVAEVFALGSLVTMVTLGLDAHGEARFVIVPMALLAASGIEALGGWLGPRAARWRRPAAALIAASLAGSVAASAVAKVRARRTFEVAARAGAAIRRAAGGAPCRVWSGQWPQLEWYSGCRAEPIPPAPAITPAALGTPTFLVWFDRGRREDPAVLADVTAGRRGVEAAPVARIPGERGLWGGARVFRLTARGPVE